MSESKQTKSISGVIPQRSYWVVVRASSQIIDRLPARLCSIVLLVALLLPTCAPQAATANVWSAPNPVDPAFTTNDVSCASSSLCVAVGGSYGSEDTSGGLVLGSVAVYRSGQWSEASVIDTQASIESVSCPTSSFCVAMDSDGGALTYNGSTWSGPVATGAVLTAVSCTSRSFCVAIGSSREEASEAAVYNGNGWSTPSAAGVTGVNSISCVSEEFCMAVAEPGTGSAYALTYNGGAWSSSNIGSVGSEAHSVSCVSSAFCVAVGLSRAITYDGSTWSRSEVGGLKGIVTSVACHSESFCVAVSLGEAAIYNGSSWTAVNSVPESVSGVVSCPTASFCMVVGGYASSYDGSTWTGLVSLGSGGISMVSCASASFCVAVDRLGRAVMFNGSMWSPPSQVMSEGSITAVSCPSSEFCVGIGGRQRRYITTFNGLKWSAAQEIDNEDRWNSVSCVSASFCVALSERRNQYTSYTRSFASVYNGSAWTMPVEIDAGIILKSVSCVSSSFCVAVGAQDAVIYNGRLWSKPSEAYPEGELNAISCVSASFCMAVATAFPKNMGEQTEGRALVYNGSSWSAPVEIPPAPDYALMVPGAVACPSASFCMAVGATFGRGTAIFENDEWSPWLAFGHNGDFSSVSCPSVSFCVVASNEGQIYTWSASLGESASGGVVVAGPGNPAIRRPVEKHRPTVNRRTGVITLEYEFFGPGHVEAYGQLSDRDAAATALGRAAAKKKCRSTRRRQQERCVRGASMLYGRAKLEIRKAGRYKIHIMPRSRARRALKYDKTLSIALTVVFAPTGVSSHIRETTSVTVHPGEKP